MIRPTVRDITYADAKGMHEHHRPTKTPIRDPIMSEDDFSFSFRDPLYYGHLPPSTPSTSTPAQPSPSTVITSSIVQTEHARPVTPAYHVHQFRETPNTFCHRNGCVAEITDPAKKQGSFVSLNA